MGSIPDIRSSYTELRSWGAKRRRCGSWSIAATGSGISVCSTDLKERRRTVEAEIGARLEWDYKEGRRRCIIYTVGDGNIADPRGTWVGVRDWIVDTLLAFRRVFGLHLAELVE